MGVGLWLAVTHPNPIRISNIPLPIPSALVRSQDYCGLVGIIRISVDNPIGLDYCGFSADY
jgi:hypothetical protein